MVHVDEYVQMSHLYVHVDSHTHHTPCIHNIPNTATSSPPSYHNIPNRHNTPTHPPSHHNTQRYILSKVHPLPLDIEYLLEDLWTLVQPLQVARYDSFEAAAAAVASYEQVLAQDMVCE